MNEQASLITSSDRLQIIDHLNLPKVNIGSEERSRKLLEPIRVSPELWRKAAEIGGRISELIDKLPNLLKDFESAKNLFGITEEVYKTRIEPFLKMPYHVLYFGVDAVVSNGEIKIVEINPQAASLGRYDEQNRQIIGEKDPNSSISPALLEAINEILPQNKRPLIISHPSNAFHANHQLLAQQIGCQIATLQDLEVSASGQIHISGKEIGLLFKQFSTNNLFDQSICPKPLFDAIQNGKVLLANSPLFPFFGDKVFLAKLAELDPMLSQYLPKMEVIRSDASSTLFKNMGKWLKGETRGGKEITLELAEYRGGWKQKVIEAIVAGDYEAAIKAIPDGLTSKTAERLKQYALDVHLHGTNSWLLQDHYPPQQVTNSDGDNLNTLLRMYFVRDNKKTPSTFIEFFAGVKSRVSAAGFTIPVRSI